MSITKFAILGERCSGTNYIEELILNNFEISYTTEHGSKHFFCFNEYTYTQDTLFIGIIRNPIYWLNSFEKELYHVPEKNKILKKFLFDEFYSVLDNFEKDNIHEKNILMNIKNNVYEVNKKDLNYETGNKYKNIFELRKLKNNYLINIMPNKVTNYILINYEDFLYNFDKTLEMISNKFCLTPTKTPFTNVKRYKKSDTYQFVAQRQITFIPNVVKEIWNNLDIEQENSLGYFMGDNNNYFKQKYI